MTRANDKYGLQVLILTPESPTGTGGSVAELERRERGYRTAATSLSLLRQGLEVQYQGPAGHHRSQTLRQQTFILINIEGSPG